MTNEEKEKAIGALKISTPVMAMTQEKFNDYIQTLNKIMDCIEQEPICQVQELIVKIVLHTNQAVTGR